MPFYYVQDRICSITKTSCVGKMVDYRSAILNAGYRVSLSHACKNALKTDAPNDFIWRMMRAWEKLHPVNKDKLHADSVSFKLLSGKDDKEDGQISFQLHPDANPVSRAQNLKRFQLNPEKNWGPKTKASLGIFQDDAKRKRNQGKKRKLVSDSDSTSMLIQ